MKKYPLRLQEIAKDAPWGGSKLIAEWGKRGIGNRLAEAWELSVREKEMTVILNGEAEGLTLRNYLELCGGDCVFPGYRLTDRFPLLIKLIDAEDRLSLQVHPDDAYASRVERDSGKTELWYIVEAEEGASIIYGLKENLLPHDLQQAAERQNFSDVTRTRTVRAGEAYWIPSGMVHAIGKGILIAEIQQNSDLTYRIDDYGRRQPDGSLRELHLEKAREVIRSFTDAEIEAMRFSKGKGDASLLANSEYFTVCKQDVRESDGNVVCERNADSFTSLLCISGEGTLTHADCSYPIRRGDSYFLPAGMGTYCLSGTVSLLCTSL